MTIDCALCRGQPEGCYHLYIYTCVHSTFQYHYMVKWNEIELFSTYANHNLLNKIQCLVHMINIVCRQCELGKLLKYFNSRRVDTLQSIGWRIYIVGSIDLNKWYISLVIEVNIIHYKIVVVYYIYYWYWKSFYKIIGFLIQLKEIFHARSCINICVNIMVSYSKVTIDYYWFSDLLAQKLLSTL